MQIVRTGNQFIIAFIYNDYLVERVKMLPGRKYDPISRTWTVPTTNEDAVNHFAKQNGFTFYNKH